MTTNLLLNGDKQGGWDALTDKIQLPIFWGLTLTKENEENIWPRKGANGSIIGSIAQGTPQLEHKLGNQLPANEQYNQPRALLIRNDLTQVLKWVSFRSSSGKLIQNIPHLIPGSKIRRTLYILADCNDIPRGKSGKLEDDHGRIRVSLAGVTIERTFGQMNTHFDVVNSNRAWNKIIIEAVVPANGDTVAILELQQNWDSDPSGIAYFIGPDSVEIIQNTPVPTQPVFKFNLLDRVTVTAQALNVRSTPKLENNIIKTVPIGTRGYNMRDSVYSPADNVVFIRVLFDDDTYGWVSQNFLA